MNGTTKTPSARIPSLDGLRAVAVSLVIARHAGYGLDGMAAFGVQIFFVLSGYLITRLLLVERERTGTIDLRAFYLRRCFRIFPAAFAYMLIVAALVPDARPDLPFALTYMSCYHTDWHSRLLMHLWSLSVEEQFYLLWPLALAFAFRKRTSVAVMAIAMAAAFRVTLAVAFPSGVSQLVHCSFPGVMDSIAAGCLLAIGEPKLQAAYNRIKRSSLLLMIGLPVSAFMLATMKLDGSAGAYSSMNPFAMAVWGIVPVMIALWIFVAVQRRDKLLNNGVAVAIGALSYSLYLWQQPFSYVGASRWNVLLVLGFACASYFLIEKPMIELGRRLPSLLARHRQAAAPAGAPEWN